MKKTLATSKEPLDKKSVAAPQNAINVSELGTADEAKAENIYVIFSAGGTLSIRDENNKALNYRLLSEEQYDKVDEILRNRELAKRPIIEQLQRIASKESLDSQEQQDLQTSPNLDISGEVSSTDMDSLD